MGDKLPYWEMARLAGKLTLSPGERVDINHEHCPAGADLKKRLNIRRTDNGNTLLFRCNHCNRGGGYHLSAKQAVSSKTPARGVVQSGNPHRNLPADFTRSFAEFSPEGRVWLLRYITESEIRRFGIGYSPSLNRVILPLYRGGKLVAWQARRLKEDGLPKYISYGLHGEKYLYCQHEDSKDTVVVCEDYLSAIKCYRYADSVALLGISIPDAVMDKLVKKGYKRVVVWLDHDNNFVTQQERKLVRRLEQYVDKVEYICSTDPKKVEDDTLKEVLV